ncbi:MAG: caspase family protein [Burkholderiaceae bacterium]
MTNIFKLLMCSAVICALAACGTPASDPFTRMQTAAVKDAPEEKLLIVDCLTAGQVRKLGAYATTITPRRALRVSAAECEAAGGEYVSVSTNPAGALKIWLPFANEGDADAQVNVGEIYERGVGGAPDYAVAAQWYERAIAKGSVRAMVNLAALYERGAGVSRDPAKARALYRQASGIAPLAERPRIQLIDPPAAVSTLRLRSDDVVRVKAAPGPYVINGRVSSESPLRNLTVNNQVRPVGERGLFSASVSLGRDPVRVEIAALDARGNSAQSNFMLALEDGSAAPPLAPGVAVSGARYALVIANQNYRHYEKLSTPHADGQAIKAVLEQRFGFDVTLLKDVTRRELLSALNNLRARVSASDQILIYYAGHGEIDGVTQRGYWIPVDGEKRNVTNWISIIDVTDQLAAMPARSVFVIADSCYSGTLTRSAVPEIDQALSEDAQRSALGQLQKNRSRIAMTSGGLEPVVDGGGGRFSIFARSLIDVLNNLREPVQAQQLFAAVNARFALLAQRLRLTQQPEYAPIRFAGHESGDFVLAPTRAGSASE